MIALRDLVKPHPFRHVVERAIIGQFPEGAWHRFERIKAALDWLTRHEEENRGAFVLDALRRAEQIRATTACGAWAECCCTLQNVGRTMVATELKK